MFAITGRFVCSIGVAHTKDGHAWEGIHLTPA
jgi:hypothetical protein